MCITCALSTQFAPDPPATSRVWHARCVQKSVGRCVVAWSWHAANVSTIQPAAHSSYRRIPVRQIRLQNSRDNLLAFLWIACWAALQGATYRSTNHQSSFALLAMGWQKGQQDAECIISRTVALYDTRWCMCAVPPGALCAGLWPPRKSCFRSALIDVFSPCASVCSSSYTWLL